MPTYTYDERVKVSDAMAKGEAAACPRCRAPIETHRLQSMQDKVLKRPGKPLYRCSSRACALECTPISYMTVAPPKAETKSPPAAPPSPAPGSSGSLRSQGPTGSRGT